MNVLITAPRLFLPGGVASYYNTLRQVDNGGRTYFEIGGRPNENGGLAVVWRMFRDSVRFFTELKRRDYDLVHINPSLGFKSCIRDGVLLLLAKLRRKPVLVMFHGWDKQFERKLESRLLPLFQFVYGQAGAFMVLAKEFEYKLRQWGFHQPVFVETTVVGDEVMNSSLDVLLQKRRESTTFNILFLARLEREKGIYETLDAFAILKQKVPHARLILAGDGPEKTPATDYATKRGITDSEFVGFVTGTEKQEVFSRAHVYLFPSYYGEGMPISVLEAMAFGLPVITRPVGGLADFFEDERMGYLTNSSDPQVLATLLEKLVADATLREAMGGYNRLYAEERFVASKVAARVEGIYAKILAGH